jgi:hypothetical protein
MERGRNLKNLRPETEPVDIVDLEQMVKDMILKYGPSGMTLDSLDMSHIEVVLDDFTYGPFEVNDVQPHLLDEWLIDNDGPTQTTQHFSRVATTSLAESWSVTRGVKIGISTSLHVGPIVSGGLSVDLTFSETQSTQRTNTITDTYTTDIPIAPNQTAEISVSCFEYAISVPWTATVRMKGEYHFTGHADPDHNTHQNMDGHGQLGAAFQYNLIQHPAITALDAVTVLFHAKGTYSGVHKQKWNWEIHSKPYLPHAKPNVGANPLQSRQPLPFAITRLTTVVGSKTVK